MQIVASMVKSAGGGTGRLVLGSFVRTIQMHCGGQTLAQMPQAVQRAWGFLVSKTGDGW